MTFFSRERWNHALELSMGSCLLLLVLTGIGPVGYSVAAAEDVFRVTKEMQITADITDLSLGQALAVLSQNMPLEIRGNVSGDEKLSLRFSQLTLQQALQEMMAGYNYVLIEPGAQEPLVLVIIGKAEKGMTSLPAPGSGGAVPGPAQPDTAGPQLVTGPVPAPPGAPSLLPVTPPGQSATLAPSPPEAPPPLAGAAPPSYDETMVSSSVPSFSGTAAPLPSAPPPPTMPVPAGLSGVAQAATTGQTSPPPDSGVQGTAGGAPNPDAQPEFNPAAWGGRGYRGGVASGRR
jgi:hypothetical protein